MTPEDVERIGASLLEGMPENPVDAHQWLMTKHADLCAVAARLELGFHRSEDPAMREAIQAYGLTIEWLISYVMGKASELLPEAIGSLGLPLSSDTEEAIQQAAGAGAETATEQIDFWNRRGRQLARQSRRRHLPRRHTGARRRARQRARSRRERHIARSTSSNDPGDDDSDGEPPPPPDDEGRRS